MNSNSQITSDTVSNDEPPVAETPAETVETPVQAPEPKKTARAKSAKVVKPVKAARPARALKTSKVEEEEAVANKPVARTAKGGKASKATRIEKLVKPDTTVKAKMGAAVTKTSKAAKPAKPLEAAKTIKPAKGARSAKKIAKSVTAAAPAAPAKVAAKASSKGARYTSNELHGAAKKAGLTIDFNPVVTKPASIGRGPAREFKVDAIVAHLRGSNGELIRDRGPGTPFHNDAESLAAVEIFEKFRSRTFHKKLKVEIL